MKRLFGYIRVSTIGQGNGVSLPEQKDAIERHAARKGFQIVDWFSEKRTAAKRGRPHFDAMLRRLRAGEADGVVIHKVDRSARNLADWADVEELLDAGFDVEIANDNLDLHSRGGRLTAGIEAVIAADFIRNNREEVLKGFNGRIKQGLYPLPAPIGYRDNGKGKAKTLDPEKAPLVRRAFERYATGDVNLRLLTDEVRAWGLRNRHGQALSKDGVWVMLKNPFYIGVIRLKRRSESFPGIHEPLISSRLFERVQRILDGKSNGMLRKHDHLFRRRFVCAGCGYTMSASLKKGHVYYRCYQVRCPLTVSVREERIEEKLTDRLGEIAFPAELQAAITEVLGKREKTAAAEQREQLGALRVSLANLDIRLGKLTDAFVDGTIERELFLSRKDALLTDQVRLREQIRVLEADAASKYKEARKIFELAGSAVFQYETGTPWEKRDLVDQTTCDRLVEAGNVRISLLSPFRELAETTKSSNGAPHQDSIATAEVLVDVVLRWLDDHPPIA